MRLLSLLLVFLLAYIEISLFIEIADVLGIAFTAFLVIFAFCAGIKLMHNWCIIGLAQIHQNLFYGASCDREIAKSFSLVLASLLLIIPGFFTDFLSLLLLLPSIQKLLTLWIIKHLKFYRFYGFNQYGNTNTFDG